jgi:DNA polymerase-4
VFVLPAATILHADVDSFFASVEQRDDPRLRGRPVIVGSWVVLAASYEAKAYGIQTAMSGSRARRLCPQAIVVEPRMSAYSEASRAMYRVFDDTTPLVEGLSIDEAFLDVRGLERISGTPAEIAVRLRRDVRERVGLPITVGVARTKFLAKVASGVAKPDGLLVVPPGGELAFLHPLPVERLWGVGRVTADKLHARSARWPSWASPCSSRYWALARAASSTPSRTTATPAVSRSAAAAARSARSAPSVGRRNRRKP